MLGEFELELVDLGVRALPVGPRRKGAHPLHQHPPVPGAVENRVIAQRRQVEPEAPLVRPGHLLGRRRRDRHDAVLPGVERRRNAPDRPALAGGVHALEHDHHRVLREASATGQQRKPPLQVLKATVVVLLGDALAATLCGEPNARSAPPQYRRRGQRGPVATAGASLDACSFGSSWPYSSLVSRRPLKASCSMPAAALSAGDRGPPGPAA